MPDEVRPLVARLPAGHVESLEHLSDELAAASLTDLFLRTGSAQARVNDPEAVRRLIRMDCRQRGCRVRTLSAHGVVVAYEDERYDALLRTEEGAAYKAEMEHRRRRYGGSGCTTVGTPPPPCCSPPASTPGSSWTCSDTPP